MLSELIQDPRRNSDREPENSNDESNVNASGNSNVSSNAILEPNTNSSGARSNLNARKPATPTASLTVEPEKLSPTEAADHWAPITAVAAILVASILAGYLAKQILERVRYGKNALSNLRGLRKAISAKNELTQKWLKKRKSANIHAIGVGKIDGTNEYCIQVFVENANGEMLEDPPTRLLPVEFRELPIVIYEMPRADFLCANEIDRARGGHDVVTGGISAANANLTGEFGTIGYFFRPNLLSRAKQAFLKNDVYLLSNAHVFADLSRVEKDDSDLIVQPSPGDSSSGRPVAELIDVSPIEFGGDVENPNFVDAAIARLDRRQAYSAEIPRIGAIRGFLRKESVTLRSDCQKFGRTTGYTRGRVFSIHLSIWVKYSARRTDALFKDQILIVPTDGSSFVKGGDSGSLVVDDQNRALGLVFAGAGEETALQFSDIEEAVDLENIIINQTPKIESYGVANSISEVMKAFGIKLDQSPTD